MIYGRCFKHSRSYFKNVPQDYKSSGAGGKGVATSLGVIFAIHPPAAGICLGIFLLVFLTFSYVSLGAIVTAISFPLVIHFVFQVSSMPLTIFSIVIGATVVITHKKNIKRLLQGCENKMPVFKKKEA